MTKNNLAQALAKKTGLSERLAEESLDVVLEEITKALSRGEAVILTGFGKFEVKSLKERTGVNPRTGERIKIPLTKAPKFRAGRRLKDAVR